MTTVSMTYFDEISSWGNPWHGSMDATGNFKKENGAIVRGVIPNDGPTVIWDAPKLVKFPCPEPPVQTTADAAAGIRFLDYALLNGPYGQYSPFSNQIRLGGYAWLYRDVAGVVWCFKLTQSGDNLVVMGRVFNLAKITWVMFSTITLAAITQWLPLVHKPSGAQAMAGFIANGVGTYVQIDVVGGTADSHPVVAMACVTYPQKNTNNGATLETLIHLFYRADGSLIEVWRRDESQMVVNYGDTESRHSYVLIGGVIHDIGSVIHPWGQEYSVSFAGRVGWTGGFHSLQYISINAGPLGVSCNVPQGPDGNGYMLWLGIHGSEERFITLPDGNYLSPADYFVEHPVTGDVINGALIW